MGSMMGNDELSSFSIAEKIEKNNRNFPSIKGGSLIPTGERTGALGVIVSPWFFTNFMVVASFSLGYYS